MATKQGVQRANQQTGNQNAQTIRPGRGRGMGRNAPRGRGRGGSTECTCPQCGNTIPHTRGIPCSQIKCPECGTPMRGAFCR